MRRAQSQVERKLKEHSRVLSLVCASRPTRLRANENFVICGSSWDVEKRLAYAAFYNDAAMKYNTQAVFPSNILATLFKFEQSHTSRLGRRRGRWVSFKELFVPDVNS